MQNAKPHGRPRPQFLQLEAGSRLLLAHWNAARGTAATPTRAEISLREIAAVLPWIAVVERGARRHSYRCRLAGTGITRLWGMDMTGRDLREPAAGFEREVMARLFEGVLARKEPFCARLRLHPAKHEPVAAEMLGLPLLAADGRTQMLAAVLPLAGRRVQRARLNGLQIAGARTIPTRELAPRRFTLIRGGGRQR